MTGTHSISDRKNPKIEMYGVRVMILQTLCAPRAVCSDRHFHHQNEQSGLTACAARILLMRLLTTASMTRCAYRNEYRHEIQKVQSIPGGALVSSLEWVQRDALCLRADPLTESCVFPSPTSAQKFGTTHQPQILMICFIQAFVTQFA